MVLLRDVEDAEREVRSIQAAIDADSQQFIAALIPLTKEDCALIGLVVQSFAYADLNGRRGLEIIDYVEGKPVPAAKQALRDNQVLPTLVERSEVLPLSEAERQNLRTGAEMFQRFADVRHLCAHWALRRHPTADALIAMTMNAKEGGRRHQSEPARFHATNAVIPMPEVRSNLPVLEKNADYFAATVMGWWKRFMPEEMH